MPSTNRAVVLAKATVTKIKVSSGQQQRAYQAAKKNESRGSQAVPFRPPFAIGHHLKQGRNP